MKYVLALAALASAFACSAANAAILTVEPAGVAQNGVYVLYLAGETTVFNGLGLSVKPDGGGAFLNINNGTVFAPRPPGEGFTYRNLLLGANPEDVIGGKNWALLGTINTPQEIAFNGGPIGQTISTAGEPGGKLWLANLMLPPGATATANLQLVNGVDTVHTQTLTFPIPEPISMGLACFALVACFAARRRRA